ncbi:MAG: DUF3343 domain-containing protein [Clostridia bacterium]|nr:DUF3343 domain-containing protein [Clostridia bacterium]
MPDKITLFTFPSTFQALRAEKAIQAAGLKGRLIPMPRELSSLCGLALELDSDLAGEGLAILKNNGIKLEKQVQMLKKPGYLKTIDIIEYEAH